MNIISQLEIRQKNFVDSTELLVSHLTWRGAPLNMAWPLAW